MNLVDERWEPVAFAFIVLALAFLVSRLLRFLVGRFIKGAAKKLKVDPTRYNFFKNAVNFLIAAFIILGGYARASNPRNAFNLICEVLKSINERFQKENIEFGYPGRILINR